MTPTIEDVLIKNDVIINSGSLKEKIFSAMTEYASLNRQGWTRVEDGKPPIDKRVLVIDNSEEDNRIMMASWTGGSWYAPFKTVTVTHWMNLPNKPI